MAAGDGLISMTPTSVSIGSGTGSINADGGVDFSAATSITVNGVFTADYDNYLIVVYSEESGNYTFALNGITGTYTTQTLLARSSDNAIIGARAGTTDATGTHIRAICNIHLYGPFLSAATAGRSVGALIDQKEAAFTTPAGSASGFVLNAGASTRTGNIHVFGYEE